MINVAGGTKVITPNRMIAQWANATHKIQVNLWNFEVAAGKKAQEVFQTSFALKRFNSSNSTPWAPRSKKNKAIHPLMVETGSLKNSIKWDYSGSKGGSGNIRIYTDPKGFANTKKHRGFCFAAVHNGPAIYRRGRVKNMPRRQFIGDSSKLDDELKKLSPMIFKGFPK